MKKENGFTLVEMIVVLFIGSLMFAVIYSIVNSAQRSSSGIERRVIAQQDARSALELMAMEIRMASYNPNLVGNIWVSPATCTGFGTGTQNYRGIQEATANLITIEMDINDNGTINTSDPNETIKYVYNSTNRYITRSTNCSVDQPFLGALNANADTKTVLVVNNEAGIPVFRYYNGSGADISATVVTSPTSLTLGIPAIRRVEITLVVDTSYSDFGTGVRRRIIYSTSVIPRNHIPVSTY
jgi:prepilin-type N-terminal cleavage/methylation domain-containing protein